MNKCNTMNHLQRAAYSCSLRDLIDVPALSVLGALTDESIFPVTKLQTNAWLYEIEHLKQIFANLKLKNTSGSIHFEYLIPRMGRRIDVLVLLNGILYVLEYKVGAVAYERHAYDQVMDYALDLKNFHETSHDIIVVPILVATEADQSGVLSYVESKEDRLLEPIGVNAKNLKNVLLDIMARYPKDYIDPDHWAEGRYQPTPTIVEAATALYAGHHVEELSRSDAGAINLAETSQQLAEIITHSRENERKVVCFVTGVPGAGKTLVGLNIATRYFEPDSDLYSVFLSGNGPLVRVLHEALARDRVQQEKNRGGKLKKGVALSQVKTFIQNVHHFRDECLKDAGPPIEHVALFDEAQRAWNTEQTTAFMKQKKGVPDFNQSEPEFLISCLDRHTDWAVVVCLVGGGQEINRGETGISGWLQAVRDHYPEWTIYSAPYLSEKEYVGHELLDELSGSGRVNYMPALHLSTSMRSFRAERVSDWVKALLDGQQGEAQSLYDSFAPQYPVVLTRSLGRAKNWIRNQARGSERHGLVVSSEAARLKPHAIDIRPVIDPVHWFLNDKSDVRSSYYMEDVATEFQVQGLELDWVCLAWDGDLRWDSDDWRHFSFRGSKWQHIHNADRQRYQLNAYRVLLTRARQGLAIVVPEGDPADPTRDPKIYDPTYCYLKNSGVRVIE